MFTEVRGQEADLYRCSGGPAHHAASRWVGRERVGVGGGGKKEEERRKGRRGGEGGKRGGRGGEEEVGGGGEGGKRGGKERDRSLVEDRKVCY